MGTTAEKINYAINATNDIAEGINNIGGNITQNTELADFRKELDKIYNELPKTSQEGTSITLENTRKGKIEITPKGNTYQQSYEGTQLIGFDDISETTINGITYSIKDNIFTLNGTATDNVRYIYNNHWKLKTAGNYNLKIEPISGTWTAGIMGLSLRRANNTQSTYHQLAYDTTNLNATKSYTDTQIQETANIGFYINANSVFSNYKFRIIYNEGSTAKDYEPYTGGTPSPNPDYPQDIKVVTGENTITINNTDYTIDLGNIELVKIGNNSDLIFKNEKSNPYYDNTLIENAWYKKKAIEKVVLDGSESWDKSTITGTVTTQRFRTTTSYSFVANSGISDKFINRPNGMPAGDYECILVTNTTNVYISINIDRLTENTIQDFKTWLQNNNVLYYIVLQTSNNIQITDTTLINQLEELNKVIEQGGTIIVETESAEENAQLIANASALASFENNS